MVQLAMRKDYQVGGKIFPVTQTIVRSGSQHKNINKDRIREEIKDSKNMPTMREIKYMFEKLVSDKYEREMKPDYEKDANEQIKNRNSQSNNLTPQLTLQRNNTQLKMQDFQISSKQKLMEFADNIDKNKPDNYQSKVFKLSFKYGSDIAKPNRSSVPRTAKVAILKTETTPVGNELQSKKLSSYSKMNEINGVGRNINSSSNVNDYYKGDDNYQDDIPFDLYNMVELAKRVNKPYTIPKIAELSERDQRLLNSTHKANINTEINMMETNSQKDPDSEFNMITNPLKYIDKFAENKKSEFYRLLC